jgi:tetratricopeptide (TPR) repeat protein
MLKDKGTIIAIVVTLLVVAAGTFTYWSKLLPNDKAAHLARAESYYEADQPQKAIEECEWLVKSALIKDSAELQKTLFIEGVSYMQLKNFDKAEDLLAAAAETVPPNEQVFTAYGKTLMQQHAYKEAAEQFTEAAKLNPKSAELRWWRGKAFEAAGQQSAASDSFSDASTLDSNNFEYWKSYVLSLEKEKQYSKALFFLDQAMDSKPSPDWAKIEKRIAVEAFNQDANNHQRHRSEPIYYADGALAMLHNGTYPDAILACNKAIQLDPNMALPYRVRADAEYELGKYTEAIEDYKRSIALDPKTEITRHHRDRALKKLFSFGGGTSSSTSSH